MKNLLTILTLTICVVAMVTVANAQITSAQSGYWSATSTWSGGAVPTSADNVLISVGHVVNVDLNLAECNTISFGDTAAHLTMGTGAVLSVYGNFDLFSTAHTVFSAWEDGAKLKFSGSAQQAINNLATSTTTTTQTFFKDIQVDKSGDTLKVPKGDRKLNIVNTLEVVSGVFAMDSAADMQGRTFYGDTSTTPTITIQSGGMFHMVGGGSHIGSGRYGTPRPPIGKVTVYGKMQVVTTSTNFINLGGIDVEAGAQLNFPTGWTSAKFNPGTITVKRGGIILHSTTTAFWTPAAALVLENGSIYKTTASNPTSFPATITNNGTVRYQRTASGDQTITDMDYYRLEISFAGNKVWTLGTNRIIQDSLEVNNSGTLVFAAGSLQTVTLKGTLRLTTGTLNNSNPNAVLALADGIIISRATGTITNPPAFGSSVNVRYTSTTSDVTTGPELPTANDVLRVLHFPSTKSVTLGANVTVNDTLSLYGDYDDTLRIANGIFDSDGADDNLSVTLADGATIRRVNGIMTSAPVFGSSVNVRYTSSSHSTITGPELPTSSTVLADLQILTDTATVVLNSNLTVNGTLTLSNGIFDNNGSADDLSLTFGNNSTIRRATGTLTTSPIFGTNMNLEYISTLSDVTAGFEVPDSPSTLNNLTLSTTMIVTLGADAVVNGAFTFVSNKLVTGTHSLYAKGSVVGAGVGKFVDGKFMLPASSPVVLQWETGNSADYLPVTMDISSITGSDYIASSVLDYNINPTAGPILPTDKALKRYIRVNKGSGISAFALNSIKFSYSDADVSEQGITEGAIRLFYYDGIGWAEVPISARDTTANLITANSVNTFGDFVIAGTNMASYSTVNVPILPGWNLVTVPVLAADMRKTTLFPGASSAAFAYANGYVQAETLKTGKAYWLKYPSTQTILVSGLKVGLKVIPVVAGWNLVGVFENDVLVSQITSTPNDIISSQFYGYSSGYNSVTTLVSGKGYWVKASQIGTLNLPVGKQIMKTTLIK
jgi:hypothetical protein